MGILFGTDGIRGVANTDPMTAEMALRVGRALAVLFAPSDGAPFVIGRDTRISGDMLAHALAAGICSMGGNVAMAGVLPTPGVAHLTRAAKGAAGIVVSASHNPFQDNGLKIFTGDGYKLSDVSEAEIEALVLKADLAARAESIQTTGRVRPVPDAGQRYVNFLIATAPSGDFLSGRRIVLDCANGATSEVAPRLFSALGAAVTTLFNEPDGRNINAGCGSQHPETLARQVVAEAADIGLAFDGDGDRLIAVDEKGEPLTGDQVLAVCAKGLQAAGRLKGGAVVSTVMSNMGLEKALAELGIAHHSAAVGDRQVLEKMRACGAVVGGEDSGHMIFLEDHTTGDGLLAALKLLEVVQSEGKPLSRLRRVMTVFPQLTLNVAVRDKPPIETEPAISQAIRAAEAVLNGRGRVLVRYSGTQALCRVMVEAPSREETERLCRQIADVVRGRLGA
ncbi:MAG: phosphoglucosamine mutase [Desulfobacteraceae bacterium]|jgi:phosphoglucosamine mutase